MIVSYTKNTFSIAVNILLQSHVSMYKWISDEDTTKYIEDNQRSQHRSIFMQCHIFSASTAFLFGLSDSALSNHMTTVNQ